MYTKKYVGLIPVLIIVVMIAVGCGGDQEGAGAGEAPEAEVIKGWTLIPTNIESEGGVLHIDFTVLNDSDDWGTIAAADPTEKPTKLTKDGNEYTCDTVQVTTDGHYLPPGFQIQGYISKREGEQTLYVECNFDGEAGGTLSIPYTLTVGEYDYYEKGDNVHETMFEVDLGEVSSDLTYPMASSEPEVEVHAIAEKIPALNKSTLENTGIERTAEGITMQWAVTNPGEYGTKVHIGRPPVVGSDGILYGVRVSPDIVDVPTAKADGGVSEFETTVEVPPEIEGLYLLLSVEQSRERLFSNYLIDLTDLQ